MMTSPSIRETIILPIIFQIIEDMRNFIVKKRLICIQREKII